MPRYFVPLNGWGKLCIKGKLHRGLIGILPNVVIRIALRARSSWYDLRCGSVVKQRTSNVKGSVSVSPSGSSIR
jgi:hypothetical protein